MHDFFIISSPSAKLETKDRSLRLIFIHIAFVCEWVLAVSYTTFSIMAMCVRVNDDHADDGDYDAGAVWFLPFWISSTRKMCANCIVSWCLFCQKAH